MKYRAQAHVVYETKYHIVWIPKYRRKILVGGVGKYFEKVMRNYLEEKYPDVYVEELSVQVDHVHMMVVIPPKYAVSSIVGGIKSKTSLRMKKEFGFMGSSKQVWSIGYFVSTVGMNETVIRKYIQNQEDQDKGRAKLALE